MSDKDRWQIAQQVEKAHRERVKYTPEFISRAKSNGTSLLRIASECGVAFDDSYKILEIGSAGTSIFLALQKGQRYAIDPLFNYIFDLYPFLKELEEYQEVNFITSTVEDASFSFKFDVIFAINVLDHTRDPQKVADKLKNLLAPGGYLIIVVDTYADKVVRNIMQFFDPDPAHPHHFIPENITALFENHRLIKYEGKIFEIYIHSGSDKGANLFLTRLKNAPTTYPKALRRRFNVAKSGVCYAVCLPLASLRRAETPFYPFKKARLFIFRNDKEESEMPSHNVA